MLSCLLNVLNDCGDQYFKKCSITRFSWSKYAISPQLKSKIYFGFDKFYFLSKIYVGFDKIYFLSVVTLHIKCSLLLFCGGLGISLISITACHSA